MFIVVYLTVHERRELLKSWTPEARGMVMEDTIGPNGEDLRAGDVCVLALPRIVYRVSPR